MVIGSIKSDNPEIAGRDPGSASTLDHAPRSGLSFWTRLRSFLYGMSTVLEIWPPPGRYLANFAVSQVEPEVSEDEDEDIFDPWQIIAENLWAAILQNKDLPMALRKKYELSELHCRRPSCSQSLRRSFPVPPNESSLTLRHCQSIAGRWSGRL